MNTGMGFLEPLIASLSTLTSRALEGIFGPQINAPLIGPITGADLGLCVSLLLLFLLLNTLLASFLRRKHLSFTTRFEPKDWRGQFFGLIGKPIYVLIWACGVYVAATPLLMRLPPGEILSPMRHILDKIFGLCVFVVVLWLFYRLTRVLESRLADWATRTETKLDDLVVPLLGQGLRILVPMVGIILALPLLGLPPEYAGILSKISSILLIATVAWVAFHGVRLGEKAALARYDITAIDNLLARKIHTQVHVLGKTLYFFIIIFTIASILMLFEEVRRFGASLLASAGVIGIIVGFAAQRTIANLFAGFQLALTQPIRLDDVVIVEGEWGRIEEITLTYVVINIWDQRRLIVPLSHFIEKPFQNWTRVSSSLMGSVFIWVDYSLPLDKVRQAARQIVEASPLWDKRYWNLQVTDATDRAMQIRILMTAADSAKAWDLRCEVREKLIQFIQANFPNSLPRVRAEI